MLVSNPETELIKEAEKKAACLIEKLKKLSVTLALAESCTAGLVSSFLAGIPGVSSVFWGCFTCYTKEAKISMLGLDKNELNANGLVSEKTARLMAHAALNKSGAKIAASVTGIAGPGGDGSEVPVGTVWAATAPQNGEVRTREFFFPGVGRNEVRIRAAMAVIEMITETLDTKEINC